MDVLINIMLLIYAGIFNLAIIGGRSWKYSEVVNIQNQSSLHLY